MKCGVTEYPETAAVDAYTKAQVNELIGIAVGRMIPNQTGTVSWDNLSSEIKGPFTVGSSRINSLAYIDG